MATIQRKIIHGRPYYYLVESRRVQGRPRPIVLQYLGSAKTLLERLQHPAAEPQRARVTSFGGIAALYAVAQQLGLLELIDQHAPKRRQGPTVGQYLLVATINRCLAPRSKLQMPAWLRTTALPRWLGWPAQAFSSQRFWDHMDLLDEPKLAALGEALARRVLESSHIDTASLLFDCTNFDTFIDTDTASELAQRGRAKSKRTDLRIVGLALLVSVDFHVPLFWKVYPGNQHDSISFAQALQELTTRYQAFGQGREAITLIFDKGNNSICNQELIDDSRFHFVGSLAPAHLPDLLAIPLWKLQPLSDPRLEPTQALRLSREIWGRPRTVVLSFSPELQRKQIRGIEQHLAKKRRALHELQTKLRRSQQPGARGKGYTHASLAKHSAEICSGQYIRELLKVSISRPQGRLALTYHTDAAAYARIKRTQLGKRIVFTDRHEWSTEQIVLAYRSLATIEEAFAEMKDPHFLGWEPMFHWTDSKIRVHAFYCVLALILASLLHRQVVQGGLRLSLQALLQALNGIQEVTNIYSPGGRPGSPGRPRVKTILTQLSPTQQELYRLLELERYRSS